jgi:hypothetical protein
MSAESVMLLRALTLGLLLASTAGADAAAYCVPGTPACCPEGEAGVIPPTRGMTPQQAREALRTEGFTKIGRLARPSDGMRVGRVIGSNPHVNVQVCLGTRVVLYEVETHSMPPPQRGRAYLRNFNGDTVPKARAELVRAGLEARISFTSCGRRIDASYPGAWAELIVASQQPPEGTPIDAALQAGALQLAPHEGVWRALEGLPLGEARGRVEARLRQAGWQVAPATRTANTGGSSGLAEPKVLAALPDTRACSVTLLTADGGTSTPPAAPATSASAPAPEAPADPTSPAVPLTAGALGGALLARMLWPRDRESTAAVVAAAPDAVDLSPRLRVRRDEV